MGSLPRILTVDPTGTIPQIVRGAIDLMDRLVIQVDTPGGDEAIEEVKRGGYDLVISAWEPTRDRSMKGWELAAKVKQESPDTSIIIVADENDPEMDQETLDDSPFVYLQRPMDPQQFLRVLSAGLDSKDLTEAMVATTGGGGGGGISLNDMGPVPPINVDHSQTTLETLLTDLGAMAIILSARTGDVILEVGAVGYLDRVSLTQAILPTMKANINMKDIVGGNASALQFYDGADYDVFVLSVGLHHVMAIVFDGEGGSRQFGGVNRYGRRAAEDLIAGLGAAAWIIQKPQAEEVRRKSELRQAAPAPVAEAEEELVLESASFGNDEEEPASVIEQMDAIDDDAFDLDDLFGGDSMEGGDMGMSLFDDLEALEGIANDDASAPKGTMTMDQARELGLIE
jgi:CheY-like chemotaxis protein